MLVTLGILAASSLIYAQKAQSAADDAKTALATNQKESKQQIIDLSTQLVELLKAQQAADAAADSRFAQSSIERRALAARQAQLEKLLALLLSKSDDPALRQQGRALLTPTPSPTVSPSSYQPSPKPTPGPTTSPSPSPTSTSLVDQVCAVVDKIAPLCTI